MNVFANPWYPLKSPALTVPESEPNNNNTSNDNGSTSALHYTTNNIEADYSAICNLQHKQPNTYADYKMTSTKGDGSKTLECHNVNACQYTCENATVHNVEGKVAVSINDNDNGNAGENIFVKSNITNRVNNDIKTTLPEVSTIKEKNFTDTSLEVTKEHHQDELMHFDSLSESSEDDCMLLPTCAYTSPQLRHMFMAEEVVESVSHTLRTKQKQTEEEEQYKFSKPNVQPFNWIQERSYQSQNVKPCEFDNQHEFVNQKEQEEEKKSNIRNDRQIKELTCIDTNINNTRELESTVNTMKSTEINKMHKNCTNETTIARKCSDGEASNETSKSQEGTSTSQYTDSLVLSTPSCYTHNPYSWMSSETVHSPANEFTQMWYTEQNHDNNNNNLIRNTYGNADIDDVESVNTGGKTLITVMHNCTNHKNSEIDIKNKKTDAPIESNSQVYKFTRNHAENTSTSSSSSPSPASLQVMLNLARRCTENSIVAPTNTLTSNHNVVSASTSSVGMTLQEVEAQLLQHTRSQSVPILHSTCPLTDAPELTEEWCVQEGSEIRPIHFTSFIPESLRSELQTLSNYTNTVNDNNNRNKDSNNAPSLHYSNHPSSMQNNSSESSSSLPLMHEISSNPLYSQSSLSTSEKWESSSKWFAHSSSFSSSPLCSKDNKESKRQLTRRRNRYEKFVHGRNTEDTDSSDCNKLSNSEINDTASHCFNSSSLNSFSAHNKKSNGIVYNNKKYERTNHVNKESISSSSVNSGTSCTTVPLPRSRQTVEYDQPLSLKEKETEHNNTKENDEKRISVMSKKNIISPSTHHTTNKQLVSVAVKINEIDGHDEYVDDTYTSLALNDSVSSRSCKATVTPQNDRHTTLDKATKQEQQNISSGINNTSNNVISKTRNYQIHKVEHALGKPQMCNDNNENTENGIKHKNNATSVTDTNKNNRSKGLHVANTALVNGTHQIGHVETTRSTNKRNTHRKTSDGWVIVEDHNIYPNKRRTDQRHYASHESSNANKVNSFTYVTKYNLVTSAAAATSIITNKTKVQRNNAKNTMSAIMSTSKKPNGTTMNEYKNNKIKEKNVNNERHERELRQCQEKKEHEEEENFEEQQQQELHEEINTEAVKEDDVANTDDKNKMIETVIDAEKKLDVNHCIETTIGANNANNYNKDTNNNNYNDNTIVKDSAEYVQHKKSNKKANNTNNSSNFKKTFVIDDDKFLENHVTDRSKVYTEKNKLSNGNSNGKKKVNDIAGKGNASAIGSNNNSKRKEKVNELKKPKEEEQQHQEKRQKQSTLPFAQVNSHLSKLVFCIMGIPIQHYSSIEDVIEHDLQQYSQESNPSTQIHGATISDTGKNNSISSNYNMKRENNKITMNTRNIPAQVRSIASYVHRCHALEDSANAKGLFVQRALNLLSEFILKHFPRLVCVVLLEGSDCFADMERMLQCCQQAMELSEQHHLPIMQMLAKLSMTRTLARIIDITNAKEHLMDAMKLAMKWNEIHTLAWIAMQMGVTRELSGHFGSSLKWYSLSEQLSMCTSQPRLLCDVHLCKAIACYAVGEKELADEAYHNATVLLSTFPPLWRIRPLQSYAQVKLQSGDLHAALSLHREELQLAMEQNDLAQISRCMSSIALALKYLGCYDEAIQMYTRELATCNAYNINTNNTNNNNSVDERQAVESLLGASLCYMLKGNGYFKAIEFANRALKEAQRCNEYCTLAKALVQLADVVSYCCHNTHELLLMELEEKQELKREAEETSRALEFLFAAMTAMARVDQVEKQQYLIKATLCELEWRCCGTFVRLIIQHYYYRYHHQQYEREGHEYIKTLEIKEIGNIHELPWNALLYCDVCNIPNTADIRGLLRRQRKRRVRRSTVERSLIRNAMKNSTTNNNINYNNNKMITNSISNTMTGNHSLHIDHDAICNYFGLDLVNRENIIALLSEPIMAGRKLVCYSLPWTEEELCVAFVIELCVKPTTEDNNNNITLSTEKSEIEKTETEQQTIIDTQESNKSYDLTITPFTLTLSSELVYLLVNHNALNDVFDLNDVHSGRKAANNSTKDENSKLEDDDGDDHKTTTTTNIITIVDVNSEMNYGDTPLWPQHYSKMAFEYEHSNSETCQQSVKAIQTNSLYCLQVLYKALLEPLESILQYGSDGKELEGVTFIGDGIFSRIPFHALHDGRHFLVEKFNITTCSSLALLETLYLTSQTELSHCNSFHASSVTTSTHTTSATHDKCNKLTHQEETLSHTHGIVTLIDTSSVNDNVVQAQETDNTKENDGLPEALHYNKNDKKVDVATNWSVHHVMLSEGIASNIEGKMEANVSACVNTQDEIVQAAIDDVSNTQPKKNDSISSAQSNQHINREVSLTTLVDEVKEELMKTNATYRDKHMSNHLYSTVHDIQHQTPECAHILNLHLPVVPETREDYCGYFTSMSQEHVIIAHAADIATTWNLTGYDLVICSACGTYAGLSFHETGIPVYRALMYAGATRLLLPIGTRLSTSNAVRSAAIQATVHLYHDINNNKDNEQIHDNGDCTMNSTQPNDTSNLQRKQSIAQAIREVQCEMISNGASLREWATYTLCGLP